MLPSTGDLYRHGDMGIVKASFLTSSCSARVLRISLTESQSEKSQDERHSFASGAFALTFTCGFLSQKDKGGAGLGVSSMV